MHGIHQSQEGKNEYFLSIVLFDLRYLCEQDLIQEYSGTPGAHLENSCRRTILHPN